MNIVVRASKKWLAGVRFWGVLGERPKPSSGHRSSLFRRHDAELLFGSVQLVFTEFVHGRMLVDQLFRRWSSGQNGFEKLGCVARIGI